MNLPRNPTRPVRIGSVTIGDNQPVAVQSMTATHTQDIAATVAQVNALAEAGADVIRIAVDSTKDAEALAEIRKIRADVKVVLTSGYESEDVLGNYRDYGFDAFLQKPCDLDTFKKIVHQMCIDK